MHSYIILLTTLVAAVAALPTENRIVGGSVTTIGQYPDIAAMLFARTGSNFRQNCGCAILTSRSFLTAAHCPENTQPGMWRIRVGSTNANSGGVVHNVNGVLMHPDYRRASRFDSDIAIMRISSTVSFGNSARQANLGNYVVGDNQVVWAAGWGRTSVGGPSSEQLRHVQIWTVNQNTCADRYRQVNGVITANMLCSGWLDVGGRDQCQGDSGGPLYHNRNVVGICSWGEQCALARFPGVNVRVSRFINWIRSNA